MDDNTTRLNCRLSMLLRVEHVECMNQMRAMIETIRLNRQCWGLTMVSMASIILSGAMVGESGKQVEPKAMYVQASDSNAILLSFRKPEKTIQKPAPVTFTPLFYAIQSSKWPNGFIPIYQTQDKKTKEWKLSRRLSHGKENFTDPLFFALPPNLKEGMVSGRWSCEAKHRDGSVDFLHWEMGQEGETIFGRFDQDTDYRFAWFIGGTILDNKLRFKAEYIDATYELEGSLSTHMIRMEGTWKHTEDSDGGTWTAEPAFAIELAHSHWKRVNLYQEISPTTGKQILSIDSPFSDMSRILCQVWLPKKEL